MANKVNNVEKLILELEVIQAECLRVNNRMHCLQHQANHLTEMIKRAREDEKKNKRNIDNDEVEESAKKRAKPFAKMPRGYSMDAMKHFYGTKCLEEHFGLKRVPKPKSCVCHVGLKVTITDITDDEAKKRNGTVTKINGRKIYYTTDDGDETWSYENNVFPQTVVSNPGKTTGIK
jgi:hypothetical protein